MSQTEATIETQLACFALTGLAAMYSHGSLDLTPEEIVKAEIILASITSGPQSNNVAVPEKLLNYLYNIYVPKKKEDEDTSVETP